MRFAHLAHVVGIILIAMAVALAATGATSWLIADPSSWAFLASAGLTGVLGYALYRSTTLERELTVREGYAVVSLAWLAVGIAGAIPYLLTGVTGSPVAALFESVSGFTTTGATIFGQVEVLPRSILFWRALTQWMGGMGIIVLGIAILPFLGVGGMQLFRAEVPGPTPERLAPRIRQTATLLWYVYGGLTAALVVLFLLGGMSMFDAVTHAFTTLSTGGFSTRDASLAAFDSSYIQYVTILFMYLAGVNFTLHFRAVNGRPAYWRDPEWRFFTLIVSGSVAIIFGSTLLQGAAGTGGLEGAFRDALFQVVSIATTTGFVTHDYELWPAGAAFLLLLLMFMGGMAGSTAGGMKAMRHYILFRQGLAELRRSLHPRAVVTTRLGTRVVRESTLLRVMAFALFFILLFTMGSFALALLGHDFLTSIGAAAASIGNIGPGLGAVGPVDNYGWMDPISHLVLILLMLAGRLEIFTVLLLFHPDLWRRYGRGRRT